ncbi:glycosyltransferase family 32 protein [Levilactobacillus namurensis]|uniref:glycosyltransferase family 32 protein n=1 Tax=Levilactobacillus namurensis TaxID=380393 RepID=UPI001DAC88A4|nr:glycosyltransferase [Levilactobacillus namurensis]HJE45716.1 glycosyl transferase [Levilactobacillus namurensis]
MKIVRESNVIPKTINYCWFGHGPKPGNFQEVLDSWKKYCPDYKIIEWNESNYDVNANEFVRYAYSQKKYAFVSDFARLDIIHRFGGVYVDVDVEFLKSLDSILDNGPFFAAEEIDRINTGLIFASSKGDAVLGRLLDIYDRMGKAEARRSLEYSNTVEIVTQFFRDMGFKFNGKRQVIANHIIYETAIFCPQQFGEVKVSRNLSKAYTIHHYNSSWNSTEKFSINRQYRHARVARRIKKYLGMHIYHLIFKIYSPLFGRGKQF